MGSRLLNDIFNETEDSYNKQMASPYDLRLHAKLEQKQENKRNMFEIQKTLKCPDKISQAYHDSKRLTVSICVLKRRIEIIHQKGEDVLHLMKCALKILGSRLFVLNDK